MSRTTGIYAFPVSRMSRRESTRGKVGVTRIECFRNDRSTAKSTETTVNAKAKAFDSCMVASRFFSLEHYSTYTYFAAIVRAFALSARRF
jgi:hypothetical protein